MTRIQLLARSVTDMTHVANADGGVIKAYWISVYATSDTIRDLTQLQEVVELAQ